MPTHLYIKKLKKKVPEKVGECIFVNLKMQEFPGP